MNKLIILILTFFLLSCTSSNNHTEEVTAYNDDLNQPGWHWHGQINKLTADTDIYAEANAKDKLSFKFPYDGGSVATFSVFFTDSTNYVCVQLSKGQFNFEGGVEDARVRFDNIGPATFRCTQSKDGSMQTIWFPDADKLINYLNGCQKVFIEATFFNEGTRVMEFDVSNLDWHFKESTNKESRAIDKTVGQRKIPYEELLKLLGKRMINKKSDSVRITRPNTGGWKYGSTVDKMTSDTNFDAYLFANKKLEMKNSKNDGASVGIIIACINGKNHIGLTIPKGQFDFKGDSREIRIRFDDEKPLTVKCWKKDSNVLDFDNAGKLIEKIKGSKRVLLELSFFDADNNILEFNTNGLVWSHTDSKGK